VPIVQNVTIVKIVIANLPLSVPSDGVAAEYPQSSDIRIHRLQTATQTMINALARPEN
jgi:hypothetical protein